MKRIVLIFLCLQILSGNVFAAELMKIPLLIEHYSEHSTHEHKGEGFGEYLWEHYVNSCGTHEHKGHCEDSLPFKHCDDCSHVMAVVLYVMPDACQINIHVPAPYSKVDIGFANHLASIYDCCIWQPPKIS
jgi:hypothetical protein